MTQDDVINYSLAKPGAFLDYPFGPDVRAVKVKSTNGPARIFAMVCLVKGEMKATLHCDVVTGELYRAMYPDAVTPGYHCPESQRPYVNTVSLDGTVPGEALAQMIDHAYAAVISRMPKKYQRELAEESP